MKLIVGLGNPDKEYENTRHNIGFMVIDKYCGESDFGKKFDGLIKIVNVNNEKVIFLKPQTYMNLSGNSVIKVVKYYDIDINDILIIQDDLDINLGEYKCKKNSSSGGHNGIKSIIENLKSEEFLRLKIGIKTSLNHDTISYVLGKFSKREMELIDNNMNNFKEIIDTFINDGTYKTILKANSR